MRYQEYLEKVELLNKYSYYYYVLDDPIATDEEYDKLYREVETYEKQNNIIADHSPTKRVGDMVLDKFEKAKHLQKMWSLEDIFNFSELKEWFSKIKKYSDDIEFVCEPKFDGASLNLIYKDGILQKAITRGDGSIGEDVTENAKTIKSIPLKIDYKALIEIRGEVVIKKSDFELLNQERLEKGENLFSNPRNASSGSLRQLDTKITAKRKLIFYPWGVGENSLDFKNFSDIMEFVYKLGFKRPPLKKILSNLEDIEDFYQEMLNKRDDIDILLDGFVIRVNSLYYQNLLGYTIKFPKFAVAYKFPAIEKVAKVEDIIIQVGRTGVLTPVAIISPTNIGGAIIRRVTLHNFDEIEKKDIKIFDSVIVIRSGDVIPKITKVLVDRRDGSEIDIKRPTNCPECNAKVLDEGKIIKCQNLLCKSRVVNSIIYFASKKCANIDGLGKEIVKLLVEKNKIKTIIDLYYLKKDDLLDLEGFKDKKINNLLNAIEKSKHMPLNRFINSLGIEHIGEVASEIIASNFKERFLDVTEEELLSIDGFGNEMVKSYLKFIQINKDFIKELFDIIKPIIVETKEISDNPFKDKTIVLTGTMSKSRDEIKKILQNLGARVTSSISKKTDFLIIGSDAGSKLEKAKKLGIEILEENSINWSKLTNI